MYKHSNKAGLVGGLQQNSNLINYEDNFPKANSAVFAVSICFWETLLLKIYNGLLYGRKLTLLIV